MKIRVILIKNNGTKRTLIGKKKKNRAYYSRLIEKAPILAGKWIHEIEYLQANGQLSLEYASKILRHVRRIRRIQQYAELEKRQG